MLFWVLVGVIASCGVVALWLAALYFLPKPHIRVRYSGAPGTMIPKGTVVSQAQDGNSYRSLRDATIGPEGYVEVPAVREQKA
jgi:hypothetical protein